MFSGISLLAGVLSAWRGQGGRAMTPAMNQGLHNGFLAAGLVWGLIAGKEVKIFFLACVLVAGVFGTLTASRKILWVQAVPGAVALALMLAV
jgi:putative membrane protein